MDGSDCHIPKQLTYASAITAKTIDSRGLQRNQRKVTTSFLLILARKKKIIESPPSFESAYLQEMPNQRNPFTKYIKDAKSKCGKSDRKNIPLSSTNN